jgi:ATP-dependent HslUV protease ATP-binding subunit HslU
MGIYLPVPVPGAAPDVEEAISLDEMTPREIVSELDKHVVGQAAAKRAIAIAVRNRVRRQKLAPELAEEIMPKNIIMIGPTGVGKTEIARRLARLAGSPFLKIEASKFTEVGYVGRDVESMIRDLVEISIDMVREEKLEEVAEKAESNAEERLLDLLLPPSPAETGDGDAAAADAASRTREKLRTQLREGKLDERTVEIEVRERNFPAFEIISNAGIEEMDINIKDMLPGFFGQRTKKRKMRVDEAIDYLIQEEEQKLVDMDQVTLTAVNDKIAGRESGTVQTSAARACSATSPIIEGTTVSLPGVVRTDPFCSSPPGHSIPKPSTDSGIAGAVSHPRRAELAHGRGFYPDSAGAEERSSQYTALLETEAIKADVYRRGHRRNRQVRRYRQRADQNRRRRLHTIMERLLDEISFEGPDLKKKTVRIDPAYVQKQLAQIVKDQDLSRYIL